MRKLTSKDCKVSINQSLSDAAALRKLQTHRILSFVQTLKCIQNSQVKMFVCLKE